MRSFRWLKCSAACIHEGGARSIVILCTCNHVAVYSAGFIIVSIVLLHIVHRICVILIDVVVVVVIAFVFMWFLYVIVSLVGCLLAREICTLRVVNPVSHGSD